MFTGIVEELGTLVFRNQFEGGVVLGVLAPIAASDASIGDSIAVNGVCLTITRIRGGVLDFDVSPETLRRSNLGGVQLEKQVHMERALAVGKRFGGHFVQGHVDGKGRLLARRADGDSQWLRIELEPGLARLIVDKGFIAVDGVSLTVIKALTNGFTLTLVPHTQTHTTLGKCPLNSHVNIEIDILAKYTAKLLNPL